MDKNAIKKYATWARRELLEKVSQKALQYGIEEGKEIDVSADKVGGTLLTDIEKKQRQGLAKKVQEEGFQQVIEEIAYTWFNRFIALRFMEVNGYLPSHIRVFTDETNNFNPQIIAEALNLDIEGIDKEKVYDFMANNQKEELYKYLLILQCNSLNSILPGLFQKISDYSELLLPDYLLREGSVLERLIKDIPEDNCDIETENGQIEIIGWLYQYYISEKHEEVIDPIHGKVVKKDEVPAATQLFTTDWVVRYLVDNSVGKYWIDHHPESELVGKLPLYVRMNDEHSTHLKDDVMPKDVSVFDPCVGSGHFLVYAFDVLMKIYLESGYSERDAASEIIKNNLFGIDIDGRATQLAYFALMMKARQYDRRFFTRNIQPNVFEISESDYVDKLSVKHFCGDDVELNHNIEMILNSLKNAKEYGSIINMPQIDFRGVKARLEEIESEISIYDTYLLGDFKKLITTAEIMSTKYAVVATNPPYLNKYDDKLRTYIFTNCNNKLDTLH